MKLPNVAAARILAGAILLSVTIWAFATSYGLQLNVGLLDRWTGKVYQIEREKP